MKSQKVYNETLDALELLDSEHQLISELTRAHDSKFERILNKYLESANNKELAFKRLDEIFTFYFNNRYGTRGPTPFMLRPHSLDTIFELLEKMNSKFQNLHAPDKKINIVNSIKDLFIEPDEFEKQIIVLKDLDPPILNKHGICILKNNEKSAWRAWIEVIKPKLRFNPPFTQWSILIQKDFKFYISETTLKKKGQEAYLYYHRKLKNMMK